MVGDSEPKFDLSGRVLVGSRVQGESGFARREFTPAGRFEPKLKTECVTVELYRFVHVGHELNHVPWRVRSRFANAEERSDVPYSAPTERHAFAEL